MSEKVDKPITTYKGFDKGLKCRGMQYEVGKTYTEDKASVCAAGFHACERPLDVFDYYPPATSRYCEVQQSGEADRESGRTKIASTRIQIGTELNIAGLVKAQIKYVKDHTTNEHTDPVRATAGNFGAATAGSSGAATAGDYGAATAGNYGAATAGDRGAATAGDCGAATAGDYGAATAGYCGAATAGDCGAATAGDRGAAMAGDYGAATARGSVCVGENGCGLVRGNSVRARGGIGAILVICEENADDFNIREWKAVVVDGETVKADTWYKLKDGELVEVPENDA